MTHERQNRGVLPYRFRQLLHCHIISPFLIPPLQRLQCSKLLKVVQEPQAVSYCSRPNIPGEHDEGERFVLMINQLLVVIRETLQTVSSLTIVTIVPTMYRFHTVCAVFLLRTSTPGC